MIKNEKLLHNTICYLNAYIRIASHYLPKIKILLVYQFTYFLFHILFIQYEIINNY